MSQQFAEPTRPWRLIDLAAVLLVFTLPLPTAWGSIAVVLLLLAWPWSGRWTEQFQRWKAVPAAMWATALLLMFIIGASYSAGTQHGVINFMTKYAKLLLLPLLVMTMSNERWRQRAIHAFLVGAVLAAALSYARFLGWVPTRCQQSMVQGTIHFGTIMAFAAYFFARKAFASKRLAWLWTLTSACIAFDVLYTNRARTGYVVLFALVVLLAWQRFGWRGMMIGALASTLLAAVAFTTSPVAKRRLDEAISNVHAYAQRQHPHEGMLTGNSMGLRLQFWQNTLALIAKHPLFGTGTGSLHQDYKKLVAGTDTLVAVNPHNEYLGTTAQLGIVGLTLLLGMGASAWRQGLKLPSVDRDAVQAVIATVAIGSLFNSLLLDVNEGRFFVVMLGLLLAGVANQARSSSDLSLTPSRDTGHALSG